MHQNNGRSQQQLRRLAKQVQKVDANHFFSLLTSPQLLEAVEASCRPPHDSGLQGVASADVRV